MMKTMSFAPKPLCTSIKVVSAIFTALMLGIPIYTLFYDKPVPAAPVIQLLFPLIWLLGIASLIRSYELTKGLLVVKRPFWSNHFQLGRNALAFQKKPTGLTIRTFGNGGAFSGSGYFWNKEIGTFRAFVTDPREGVWIKTPEKTLLVTPDDPAEFMKSFEDLKEN